MIPRQKMSYARPAYSPTPGSWRASVQSSLMKAAANLTRVSERRWPNPRGEMIRLTSCKSACNRSSGVGHLSKNGRITFSTCRRLVQFNIKHDTRMCHLFG